MSREIKFRAWDKDQGQMVYIDLLRLNYWDGQVDSGWYEDDDGNPHDLWSEIKEGRLMRYTGLKDKNGVEIYEGDILSDGAVVEWFDNLAWDSGGSLHSGFYTKKWASQHSDDITTELSYHDGFDDCEVIGNIYEHPELLKAGDARDN